MKQATFATTDDGFSVLEVLVAFIIVTMGLMAAFAALGIGYRQSADSRLAAATISFAQSHLDRVGIAESLAAGTTTGTYANGVQWQLDSAEIPTLKNRGYVIDLVASTASGRRIVHLRSVKIAGGGP